MSEKSDDDWFERALSDDQEETADTPSPGESPDSEESSDAGDSTEDRSVSGDAGDRESTATPEEGFEAADADGDGAEGDGSLFEQDFASALGDAPDTGGGTSPGGGPSPEGQPPGGPPAGDSPDLDVGDEFDMGSGEFGMGGEFGGLGGGSDFEDEEFETEIDRIDLGIEGLDDMIQGGVPDRSLMVAVGSAGTGKTTFGIQFLNEELRQEDGGNAVFITLEESRERIIKSATEKGFPFDDYAESDRLAIVDLDPVEMANSLATIRSELPRLIGEFDANRLVLDSVSLLEMMYDSRANRRNEIYDFTRSLKDAGVTTMLTSEASSDSAYTSRYGIVEYLTDAVFVLQYVRPSDFRKTRLAVEIQKIRDANHSRETKPYEITSDGISVYRQANIF